MRPEEEAGLGQDCKGEAQLGSEEELQTHYQAGEDGECGELKQKEAKGGIIQVILQGVSWNQCGISSNPQCTARSRTDVKPDWVESLPNANRKSTRTLHTRFLGWSANSHGPHSLYRLPPVLDDIPNHRLRWLKDVTLMPNYCLGLSSVLCAHGTGKELGDIYCVGALL